MTLQFEVVQTSRCQRCDGESYLAVRIAHPSYLYPHLQPEKGMVTFDLCPQCDKDNPQAQGLLAYFACYGAITPEALETFVVLSQQWVRSLSTPRSVTAELFEADVDAYHRGEFE